MDIGNIIIGTRSPATTAAVTRIANLLLAIKPDEQPAQRLPPASILCRQFRCSGSTLKKAFDLLRPQGVLTTIPGGGTFLGDFRAASPTPLITTTVTPTPHAIPRWQMVRNEILATIADGHLSPGDKIPSIKELAARYKTSHRVVCAALADLVHTGRLTGSGRGFRVFQTIRRGSSATVVLICATNVIGILGSLMPRTRELWQTLEKECDRHDLALTVWSFSDLLDNAGQPPESPVLGYLVMSLFMSVGDLKTAATRLSQTEKPVSFLDETGVCIDLAPLYRNNRFRVFSLGVDLVAGRIVGDHLLSLGHRHVAYFSMVPHDRINTLRGDGVEQAFTATGVQSGVRRFSLNQFDSADEMYSRLENTSLIKKSYDHADLAWHDLTGGMNRSYLPFLPSQIADLGRIAFMNIHMPPLFEQALADPAITAWVAYNDPLAFVALNYLTKKKVRVPGDISLIGFDDTVEAFGNGLSSYYFNTPGTVRGMLDHIIRPPLRRHKPPERAIEMPGYVMARKTTGHSSK